MQDAEIISDSQCKILWKFFQNTQELSSLESSDLPANTLLEQIRVNADATETAIQTCQPDKQERINDIVVGALYDFVGFLTTRKERLIMSSFDDVAPAAEGIKEYFERRNITTEDPHWSWYRMCKTPEPLEDVPLEDTSLEEAA